MDIPAFSINASAKATVNPDDPFASGSYTIGNTSSSVAMATVDQLFTVKAVAMTGTASLNLTTGVLSAYTGGTIYGGDGKDADGETVALGKIMALHIRNTGATAVNVENGSYTGTDYRIVEFLSVHPGGEALITAPSGSAFTLQTIDLFDPALGECSFDLMVVGKI